MLSAWLELVAYLYDGRLAALIQAGRSWMPSESRSLQGERPRRDIAKHVGLLASGAATSSSYSRGLLRFLSRYGLRGVDPAGLRHPVKPGRPVRPVRALTQRLWRRRTR